MKKLSKIMALVVCCLMLVPFFVACQSNQLTYSGKTLEKGIVGMEYGGDVAFAEGTDKVVTYALKEGSSEPAGLLLTPDGSFVGIPKAKGSKTFTVIASAEKSKSVEAEFTLEIGEGQLVYEANDSLRLAVDRESTLSLAMAQNAGGDINYDITDGDELPTGLVLSPEGELIGIPTVVGESSTFTVTASSPDCVSASAEFTLNIVMPWLEIKGSNIPNGRVGEPYAAELPAATGLDAEDAVVVTYAIKDGSVLPSGLKLEEDGLIWSDNLTETAARNPFIVTVSAPGYTPAEATFTVTVRSEYPPSGETGEITYETMVLDEAYVGAPYNAFEKIANAMASNYETITYSVAPDSELPEGFSLYPSGLLRVSRAVPFEALGTKTFSIVASAAGCADKTVSFSLKVNNAKLKFKGLEIAQATVGDAYTASIAFAVAPGGETGTTISYALREGSTMPAGLVLDADGTVHGTPTKSAKKTYFAVVASAPNYSSVTAEIFIKIRDAVTTVGSNGMNARFEAEYLDLSGKYGSGYSGSAQEEGMILDDSPSASNGRYLGFLHTTIYVDFVIRTTQDVSGAKLSIMLCSELFGETNFKSGESLAILVNGTPIDFGTFTVSGDKSVKEYLVTANGLNLLKDQDNVIRVQVLENLLLQAQRTGGPGIDCIQIDNYGSSTELSWRPCLYNIG